MRNGAGRHAIAAATLVGVLSGVGMGGASFAWAAEDTPSMDWSRAFPVARARRDVHLEASFIGSDGRGHRLELWRHGQTFLHRRTDDALDVYVAGRADSGDYNYRFVDHRRHLVTGVHRDNLYRIGAYSDWFGLAYVVDRPKAAFRLRAIGDPHPESPRHDCVWRELVITGGATANAARICWSGRWGTAMVIEQRGATGAWAESLKVEEVGPAHFRPGATLIPATPSGYGYVDADREIAPQAGD